MKNFNWKKILPHAIAVFVFLIISIAYTKPALEGKVVQQHDVQQWKGMAQQSYAFKEKTGHFPLWTNSMFCGMPGYQIAIDSKDPAYINVYYVHLILTFGLPKPCYYLFLCCLGFYLLASVLGVNSWLSMVGGIAYGYCSYNPILISAGHDTKLLSMAYAPAVLASLALIFKKKYWIGAALLIVTVSNLFSQSHQQIAYYTFLMAVIMTVPFLVKSVKEKDFKHIGFSALLAIVGATLSLLFVSNSYFPTYEYSKETMRGGGSGLTLGVTDTKNKTKGGLDKDYAFTYSYGIAESFTLLVPNATGGAAGDGLKEDSKVVTLLQNSPEIPQQMGQQLFQVARAYWGNQPAASPVYFGAFICLLSIIGFVVSKNNNKWWLLAVTVAGIVMAWGKNLESINYFLFDYLPLYKKFRAPSMSLTMAQISVPLMAVLFLQEFFETAKDKQAAIFKKALIVAGSTAGVLIAYYVFAAFTNESTLEMKKNIDAAMKDNSGFVNNFMQAWKDDRKDLYVKDMLRSLALMGIAIGLLWAFVKNYLKPQPIAICFIVLALIDLLPIGRRYFNEDNFVDADTYEQAYAKYNADIQLESDKSFYRVLNLAFPTGNGFTADIGNSFNDALASYHHNTIGGYHPAKLSIYEDLKNFQIIKNIQAWAGNSMAKDSFPVLNMLNMKYIIVPDQKDQKQTMAVPNPFALGNCWFVKNISFVKNADEEMKALDKFNPSETVFIQEKYKTVAGANPTFDSTASIKLIENKNDYITYESKANSNQFAVFSEIYYSAGWNAYVDGKKVDYCKVNYALRGMPVPAGNHKIEFKFEPSLVHLGEQLSKYAGIVSVLLVLLFAFLEWKSYKKQA